MIPPNLDKNTTEFPHQFPCCIAHLHSTLSDQSLTFRMFFPPDSPKDLDKVQVLLTAHITILANDKVSCIHVCLYEIKIRELLTCSYSTLVSA